MLARGFFSFLPKKALPLEPRTLPSCQTRSFNQSTLLKFPCTDYMSNDETPDIFQDRYHKSTEELRQELEEKLCDARSVLSEIKHLGIELPENLQTKIDTHLEEHKAHRIEEHNTLINDSFAKLQQLSETINEQAKSNKALLKEANKLTARLKDLEAIDIDSPEFLNRETTHRLMK